MALPELERTPAGWEMQFATNFLGHFALTLGLRDALVAANGARVVCLSSSAHMFAPVFFDDPHFAFIPYAPFVAYGQSKTACALMALGLTRRWANDGIRANAVNPGAIATGLQRHTGGMQTPPERRKTRGAGRRDLGAAGGLAAARRASAVATSRTATRRCRSRRGRRTSAAAWHPTRSTPATPTGSGTSPSTSWPERAATHAPAALDPAALIARRIDRARPLP